MSVSKHRAARIDDDIRLRFGARPVINLTGTLTALGGISARPEAIDAAAAMMSRGVDITELQACASRLIAEATGAEAGFVAACSSAGICMAVAGAMTGDDLARIEALPDTDGLPNEVVIQTGHLVNYGHPVAQDVRQTGAAVVRIGEVNAARPHHLSAAIGANTAAGLYVVSHHCVADGQIGFDEFVHICHAHKVPVIVDLAAEYALHTYLDAGADITVHSVHKFLGGATAGIVSGRKPLVRAAYLQNFGIGRPMKVGKEGIASALAALQCFVRQDQAAVRREDLKKLKYWQSRLADRAGIRAEIDADPTGNPFDRLKVSVDAEAAGVSAVAVVQRLETGDPPIMARTHQLEQGYFIMDPRSLGDGELEVVADRLCHIIDNASDGASTDADIYAWRQAKSNTLLRWPDLD